MHPMQHIALTPSNPQPPTRDHSSHPSSLPQAQQVHVHPRTPGSENASLYFVGTATTILEYGGLRIMTDPNFLHAGDHVHLGPGVTGTRKTNPAIELDELPPVDIVLLSHYHADHFDEVVERRLRRDLPIVTTPHAKAHLAEKGEESFTRVTALDFWESALVGAEGGVEGGAEEGKRAALKVTGIPGKHVPDGVLAKLNDLVAAVPPTNGWMLELGRTDGDGKDFTCGYRIYISGDTLLVDDLKEIPRRYAGQNIDLMLVHLGGTTIPSPNLPLLMVTMDAEQGLGLLQLINPDLTIPIHYDDYDVFLSPLADFKKKIEEAGLTDKVVYLDRGSQYRFRVVQ